MKIKLLKVVGCLGLAGFVGISKGLAADPASLDSGKPVYEHYLKIQTALAADNLTEVAENAQAIAKAVRLKPGRDWPARLAARAEALAKATDLGSARAAFKPLSESLIEDWAARPAVTGQYQRAYCPMARAAWLQTGTEIRNPYLGKAMLHCGSLLPRARPPASTSGAGAVNPSANCPGVKNTRCTGENAGCCAH